MRCWLSGVEVFESPHVMQAVRQLNHYHPNVVRHGQQHFADVFGLPLLGREQNEPADLGCALHKARHVWTEMFGISASGNSVSSTTS